MNSTTHSPALILPLQSNLATLPLAGGKGANLSRLIQAGFPVPDGFLITTEVYSLFLAQNDLEQKILTLLQKTASNLPEDLERASNQIRDLFRNGKIYKGLKDELSSAYHHLGEGAVAVRSSATMEDLPDLSFAGQQDTFLNVIGDGQLQKAIIECWSSLWTARAIGYRNRHHLSHREVSLAVIVQKMVPSQVSGVLFTANPLTGVHSETVIDATFGLGEALVSGMVEPDHYVVDANRAQILSKTLGHKAVAIYGKTEGGTRKIEEQHPNEQALSDEKILALSQLGKQVEHVYALPQDIEWAWAEDKLILLQSRPITTLYPLPEGVPVEPLKVWFSFAAVQGMLDPITPLGRDALCQVFAAGAGLFGIHATPATQTVLLSAGERLWVNITPLLKNSVGRRVVPVVLDLVEPTVRQAVGQIMDDPRLQPERKGVSFHARGQIARFFLPLAGNVLLNLISPQRRREFIIHRGEQILNRMEAKCTITRGNRWEKLSQQSRLLPDLSEKVLRKMLILFISGVAAGMASWNLLNILSADRKNGKKIEQDQKTRDLILQVTRGMPYNPTTEMDLELWKMAKVIRHDQKSMGMLHDSHPMELSNKYLSGGLPENIRQPVHAFLQRYGGRGLGEIDLGRTRWAEDATHVFEMLDSFLKIEDNASAPDSVFTRSALVAQQAVAQLAVEVRKKPGGWIKSGLVKFFAGRARQMMGIRESPKFFAVRMMWIIHRELLKTGQEFVQAGDLVSADDMFYLTLEELNSFSVQDKKDWKQMIANRRATYQRELLRKQIPRLLLSDGRAFYEGISSPQDSGNIISGSPVSPGRAEGKVRVVLDPTHAHLLPGEIMVCPGTDPSWTPLFLSAGGLVMETGGMMTHGAVVAREYGIPAIVGVDKATQRLKTGQRIQIDGSEGKIVLLDKP